jgi:hypothetical protein
MSLSKQNAKPKYCKVCHDTGKDEKTYTSHYVRENPDPTSRIVCPTLLSMECKYCFKKGHTVKFCKVIKNRSYKQQHEQVASKPPASQRKSSISKSNNIYDLLDDDEETPIINANTLPQPPQMLSGPAPLNYSRIIEVTNKQVADEEKERATKEQQRAIQEKQQAIKEAEIKIIPKPIHHVFKSSHLNWADDSSDEEEGNFHCSY